MKLFIRTITQINYYSQEIMNRIKIVVTSALVFTFATAIGATAGRNGKSTSSGKAASPAPETATVAAVTGKTATSASKAPASTKGETKASAGAETKTASKTSRATSETKASPSVTKTDSTASSAKPSVKTGESVKLTPSEEDKLLTLLNKGSDEELLEIDGIAATRAKAIASARPFQNVHEVILVPGVGDATFRNILAYGKKLKNSASKPAKS
jgi:DNA uptake protein ComE-like DNA-binding protein